MITHIPASEWRTPDRKPHEGQEVLAYGTFSIDGDHAEPCLEIVTYDIRDQTWNIADDNFCEFVPQILD